MWPRRGSVVAQEYARPRLLGWQVSDLRGCGAFETALPGKPPLPEKNVHKSSGIASRRARRSAVSAYFVYQGSNRIDWRSRQDAVAEIEDVPGRGAERIEHTPRGRAHLLGRRKERHRIEISLQRNAAGGDAARFARIACPIESDHLSAARHHRVEPRIAAFGEENPWDARNRIQNLARIGEREHLVVVVRERAAQVSNSITAWAPASICAFR